MFKKKYLVSLILDNQKDAALVSAKEGYGNVNTNYNGIYPLTMTIQKRRTYWGAVNRCREYFKMGIYCTVIKAPLD